MSCACFYGIRFVTKHTFCLDIFAEFFYGKDFINNKIKKEYPSTSERIIESGEGVALIAKKDDEDDEGKKKAVFTYICFFLAGIALNLTWGAISFIAPYWIDKYGKDVWRDFVVCYNFPGFPILLLQLYTDERSAKKFGTRKTYLIRLMMSFLLLALLCGFVPLSQYYMAAKTSMLIFVIILGAAIGLAHGWIYSIVALYPPQAVSYLVAGSGASTILLLILTVCLNYPTNISVHQQLTYFEPVCALSVLGTFFIVGLLSTKQSKAILSRADYLSNESINAEKEKEKEREGTKLLKDETPPATDPPVHTVKLIWSPMISIFATTFAIVTAVTLIALIPSANNNPKFPAYILYISSIAGFVGNELAVFFKKVAKPVPLLVFSLVRILILPFLLIYSIKQFWLNDIFILCILALFAITGSFCISKCYSLCSASVSLARQASASNWLNISLYLGIYLALAVPYVLPYIVPGIPE